MEFKSLHKYTRHKEEVNMMLNRQNSCMKKEKSNIMMGYKMITFKIRIQIIILIFSFFKCRKMKQKTRDKFQNTKVKNNLI